MTDKTDFLSISDKDRKITIERHFYNQHSTPIDLSIKFAFYVFKRMEEYIRNEPYSSFCQCHIGSESYSESSSFYRFLLTVIISDKISLTMQEEIASSISDKFNLSVRHGSEQFLAEQKIEIPRHISLVVTTDISTVHNSHIDDFVREDFVEQFEKIVYKKQRN